MSTEIQKEVYIENKLDYGKFILEPASKDDYKEITKDFALSNLDPKNLLINELRMEIANILILYPDWFHNSIASFLRDVNSSLQLNRSKFGFQSKLERSNLTGDSTGQKSFEQQKNSTIFGNKAQ